MPTTAAQIYAASQGMRCEGAERCHYCGSPCDRNDPHKDPPRPMGIRPSQWKNNMARLPGSQYQCRGCAAWFRRRNGACYLGGGVIDGMQAGWLSWFVTPGAAWALKADSGAKLYEWLIKSPPCRFFLALLDGDSPPENRLHMAVANDHAEVTMSSVLYLTVNNVPHEFTVYQLMQSVRQETGLDPGVGALVRLFGRPSADLVPAHEQPEDARDKKRGRPPALDPRERQAGQVIRMSGA